MSDRFSSRWFKEERSLPKDQRDEALTNAKELLGHSGHVLDKLKRILEEDIEATYKADEDVGTPEWTQRALANAGARKALREIHNLIP